MEDIARLVNRILVINKGEIVLSGTPTEIFSQIEQLENIGLSTTQAAYIARDLRQKGFDLPQDIFTVDAVVDAILANLEAQT